MQKKCRLNFRICCVRKCAFCERSFQLDAKRSILPVAPEYGGTQWAMRCVNVEEAKTFENILNLRGECVNKKQLRLGVDLHFFLRCRFMIRVRLRLLKQNIYTRKKAVRIGRPRTMYDPLKILSLFCRLSAPSLVDGKRNRRKAEHRRPLRGLRHYNV